MKGLGWVWKLRVKRVPSSEGRRRETVEAVIRVVSEVGAAEHSGIQARII